MKHAKTILEKLVEEKKAVVEEQVAVKYYKENLKKAKENLKIDEALLLEYELELKELEKAEQNEE